MVNVMDLDTCIRKRYMCRAFQKKPVEKDKIDKLLANAYRSPSAGHLQPQEYILITDPEKKRRLAEAALNQDFIVEAPIVIVVCADTRRNVWRYRDRGRNFYSIIDGAFASMIILLTAIDEGLGACFVGAFNDKEVSDVLELPTEVRPIGIIPLGYPREPSQRLDRRPLAEIIHSEKW